MMNKEKDMIQDEDLNEVAGGDLQEEDKEWVKDIIWRCVENGDSWSDVVEKKFRDIEPYCNEVNAMRSRDKQVTPSEIDKYMQHCFFIIGKKYLEGEIRDGRRVRRRR